MASGRLRRKWARNILTVLAIAVSFSMLLSLSSISLGLHRASEERLSGSPRDIVISSLGLQPSIENSHEIASELKQDRNLSAVMPVLTVLGRLALDKGHEGDVEVGDKISLKEGMETMTVGMVGIVPDMALDFMEKENELFIRSDLLRFNGWFSEGSDPFHGSNYSDNWTGELILDENILDEHGLDIGDRVYQVNGSGQICAEYTIRGSIETSLVGAGLTAELLGGIGMVHLGELQWATGNHKKETPEGMTSDLANAIYLNLDESLATTDAKRRYSMMLESRFPGLEVTSKESRLYRIDEEVLILEVFAVSVAAATISIGLLFLSSIMIIDVEDRKADISIMRAIGISRRTIFLQTVRDSLVLSSLGAVIGLIPGWQGSSTIDAFLRELYGLNIAFSSFEPLVFMGSIIYLFVLASIFSLVPAIWATTIMPGSTLKDLRNR
ncbi:MAG: ABC transporter permease [Candidatus Thermoplasmatota archaeon]|nr:ABC transporter permease [Candidatus Thermoplasmatota archaeon]